MDRRVRKLKIICEKTDCQINDVSLCQVVISRTQRGMTKRNKHVINYPNTGMLINPLCLTTTLTTLYLQIITIAYNMVTIKSEKMCIRDSYEESCRGSYFQK